VSIPAGCKAVQRRMGTYMDSDGAPGLTRGKEDHPRDRVRDTLTERYKGLDPLESFLEW